MTCSCSLVCRYIYNFFLSAFANRFAGESPINTPWMGFKRVIMGTRDLVTGKKSRMTQENV